MSAADNNNAHGASKPSALRLVPAFAAVFGVGFLVPSIVHAAPQTFAQLVGIAIGIINPLAGLLITSAVLFFFFNIIRFIYSAGSEGREKYRENITWSIIAIFVLVSVFGLARLVSNTFLGAGSGAGGTTSNEGIDSKVFEGRGCGPSCI